MHTQICKHCSPQVRPFCFWSGWNWTLALCRLNQRSAFGIVPREQGFWDVVAHWDLGFTDSTRLAPWAPVTRLSVLLPDSILYECQGSISGTHAYRANILCAELLPHTLLFILRWCLGWPWTFYLPTYLGSHSCAPPCFRFSCECMYVCVSFSMPLSDFLSLPSSLISEIVYSTSQDCLLVLSLGILLRLWKPHPSVATLFSFVPFGWLNELQPLFSCFLDFLPLHW